MPKMTFFEMRGGAIFSVQCDKMKGFKHKCCGFSFLECFLDDVCVARVLFDDIEKFYIYEEDDSMVVLYDHGFFYDTPYNVYHNEGGLHEI